MDRALFETIGAAAANSKSDNIRDGKGQLVVLEHVYGNYNDGPTFIASFKVTKSEAKGDLELTPFIPGQVQMPRTPNTVVTPNAVGSCPAWKQKIQKFKSAAGNVKAYHLALLGYKEQEVTPQQFSGAMAGALNNDPKAGAVQPCRGMLIDFETYRQVTKTGANAGSINTYVRFTHVPIGTDPNDANSNHPTQIALRRAELDKTNPVTK